MNFTVYCHGTNAFVIKCYNDVVSFKMRFFTVITKDVGAF